MNEYKLPDGTVANELGVKKYYPNISINFSSLGDLATPVLVTPKPTPTTNLRTVYRDGVTVDALGNTVQAWDERDMFSDYLDEEGVLVTKLSQEEAYLAKVAKDYREAKIKEITTAVDQYIQAKIDEYNVANGVLFADINALVKYTLDPTYVHYNFCSTTLLWNASIWEAARAIQIEVFSGLRAEPTVDEILAELDKVV